MANPLNLVISLGLGTFTCDANLVGGSFYAAKQIIQFIMKILIERE